jgi:hypothetical protein
MSLHTEFVMYAATSDLFAECIFSKTLTFLCLLLQLFPDNNEFIVFVVETVL